MKSREPSGSTRRRSSALRLMKVPSFFHSKRTGVASSLCAEQLSRAEFPRKTRVSWGSTVNQKGLKGCTAEPGGATGESSSEIVQQTSPGKRGGASEGPRVLWYPETLTSTEDTAGYNARRQRERHKLWLKRSIFLSIISACLCCYPRASFSL